MTVFTRADVADWIVDALQALGGEAHMHLVARKLWEQSGKKLTTADAMFYTWQYDMRWAAQKLRDQGRLLNSGNSDLPKGVWALVDE